MRTVLCIYVHTVLYYHMMLYAYTIHIIYNICILYVWAFSWHRLTGCLPVDRGFAPSRWAPYLAGYRGIGEANRRGAWWWPWDGLEILWISFWFGICWWIYGFDFWDFRLERRFCSLLSVCWQTLESPRSDLGEPFSTKRSFCWPSFRVPKATRSKRHFYW